MEPEAIGLEGWSNSGCLHGECGPNTQYRPDRMGGYVLSVAASRHNYIARRVMPQSSELEYVAALGHQPVEYDIAERKQLCDAMSKCSYTQ